MAAFIHQVIEDLQGKGTDPRHLNIVLPGKRAALFFKREYAARAQDASWLPRFMTIEDLVEDISGLDTADNITLLLEFYDIYRQRCEKPDPFDAFSRWATVLLQDFNEIDRYLVEPDKIFSYLSDIEQIENWLPEESLTEVMQNYFSFWKQAAGWYHALGSHLHGQGRGYQGMVFREAVENGLARLQDEGNTWAFVGFNALNNAEVRLIDFFRENRRALLYFDSDKYYLDNPGHEAGMFLRRYRERFCRSREDFMWAFDNLSGKKNVEVIGAPRLITQAKIVGSRLKDDILQKGNNIEDTAVVLCDETLLMPLLDSLPVEIKTVNLTMGYPLEGCPAAILMASVMEMHTYAEKMSKDGFYFKNVVKVLEHPLIYRYLVVDGKHYGRMLTDAITRNNIVVVTLERLRFLLSDFPPEALERVRFLFGEVCTSACALNALLLELIGRLRRDLSQGNQQKIDADNLQTEYLFVLSRVLGTLGHYLDKYDFITELRVYLSFFRQVLSGEKLSFYGEPLSGLQVMGVLETRLLDFKNLILTSVNEGILPSGKNENSFIPFDVKKTFGIPTHQDKDAIYAYHFYRLIQRAENITLLYNTEAEGVKGAEESRFIWQLRYEFDKRWDIKNTIVSFPNRMSAAGVLPVAKSPFVLQKIRERLQRGVSPTMLNTYLQNPLEFYYNYVLELRETEQVEETAEANTIGDIIHNSLEDLYRPFAGTGRDMSGADYERMVAEYSSVVESRFSILMEGRDFSTGKNYLLLQACKRAVFNFLSIEKKSVESGARLQMLQLEKTFEMSVQIPGVDFPVKLCGRADRIDRLDGLVRVVDYKSGKVESKDVVLKSWADISVGNCPGKVVQLLMYALMYGAQDDKQRQFQCGIYSLKDSSLGLIPLTLNLEEKEKRTLIEAGDLSEFTRSLSDVIAQMLDPQVPLESTGMTYREIFI